MAGYSGTPLTKKLGIKEGFRVAFVGAPRDFAAALEPLPSGVVVVDQPEAAMDLILLFVDQFAIFQSAFPRISKRLAPAGMVWVCWPKKSSGVASDLDENRVRDFGLSSGLVDVKVCAVDEVWSGLKFVIRLKDRPKSAEPETKKPGSRKRDPGFGG